MESSTLSETICWGLTTLSSEKNAGVATIAALSGLNIKKVEKILSGTYPITIKNLEAILKTMDTSLFEFFNRKEVKEIL